MSMVHQVQEKKCEEEISIVVADPDPLVRRGLRELLEAEGDLKLVGKAEDLSELRRILAYERVDSILMDFQLAKEDDFAIIGELRARLPRCQIIVMGTVTDSEAILRVLRLGATGYLPKRGRIEDFRKALRQVLLDMNPLLPDVAQQLIGHVIRSEPSVEPDRLAARLSAREREVLECMTQGMCNKEIARTLHVTDRTVKAHVSSILRKLRVSDRTQAVVKALKMRSSNVG